MTIARNRRSIDVWASLVLLRGWLRALVIGFAVVELPSALARRIGEAHQQILSYAR
jgi:hypothetical protein